MGSQAGAVRMMHYDYESTYDPDSCTMNFSPYPPHCFDEPPATVPAPSAGFLLVPFLIALVLRGKR